MTFQAFGRSIGAEHQPLIIAELSGNHNGNRGRAIELLRVAHQCGADVVKLQTYTADTITMDAPGDWFRIGHGPWSGRRLHELYNEASTPWAWHAELITEADRLGLPWFSSPFDPTAVEFLLELGCPVFKVASFEVVDIPLLECIARTGRPVIMSVGMSTLAEIDTALRTLRRGGSGEIALLHCISTYPAPAESMHLRNIQALAMAFGCTVGLSDHSPGHTAAVAAVALGACIIEKHLCMARSDGGPDAAFSLEPAEFAALCRAAREAHGMLSTPAGFGPVGPECDSIVFRKSLFITRDLPAGHILTASDVRCIRPGHGLPPIDLPKVLGRPLRISVARGTPLAWDLLG